jgi:alkyl sulfatase BDS1-like metallo-beta-lactamase superfamily hydrolase
LSHRLGAHIKGADASIELDSALLNPILTGQSPLEDLLRSGEVKIKGRKEAIFELLSLLDAFNFWFNIVIP